MLLNLLKTRLNLFKYPIQASMSTSMSAFPSLPSPILFGPHEIAPDQVFLESELSLGIVNIKPILPGHVLIIPKRVCDRFKDLSQEEVVDLWLTAQEVGHKLEEYHEASSLNMAIQDGESAGQSVPHVHVHIIPRKPRDIPVNDQIHEDLENIRLHDEFVQDEDRKVRSMEEMAAEAAAYRPLFQHN